MSLQTRVEALATRVATEFKAIRVALADRYTKGEADGRYRQSTYNVLATSTSDTKANQWTKIAVLRLTGRYQDVDVVMDFLSFGSGNTATSKATVMARLKQQDVMGNLPQLFVGVEHGIIINPNDLRLVTTVTSATETIAELWFRDTQPYDIMTVTESYFAHGGGTVTYLQQQPFQVAAPTGLQFVEGVSVPIALAAMPAQVFSSSHLPEISEVNGLTAAITSKPTTVTYTNVVPARPTGATVGVVVWIGQVDPAANTQPFDIWVPTA